MDSNATSNQISSLRIARIFQSGGRLSVPVKPSHTVFAQFRHVSGTPASAGENAVPISRLRLLNHIVSILRAGKNHLNGSSELVDLQFEKIEIKEYSAKTIRATTGLVFNHIA